MSRHLLFLFLLLSVITFSIFFPLGSIFFVPGMLVYFSRTLRSCSIIEKFGYCVGISLSFWIGAFQLLKFVKAPYLVLINSVTLFIFLSFVIYVIAALRKKIRFSAAPGLAVTDIIMLLVVIGIMTAFHSLFTHPVFGIDLTFPSYISKVITLWGTYPESFEPLIPITPFNASMYGFSILAAGISLTTSMPIYQATYLLVSLTYPLFFFASYVFLRNYFSSTTSLLSSLLALFVSRQILYHATWGGETNILSVIFLLFAVSYALKAFRSTERISPYIVVDTGIIGLFLFACFFTHNIYFVAFSFFAPVGFVYACITNRHARIHLLRLMLFFLCAFVTVFLLAIPFLLDAHLPSAATLQWIREWQNTVSGWTGSIESAIPAINKYILNGYGAIYIMITLASFIGTWFIIDKNKQIYYLSFFVLYLYIFNSKYWFLPFSYFLYPDRVRILLTIPFAYISGLAIEFLIRKAKRTVFSMQNLPIIGLFLSLFVVFTISLYEVSKKNFDEFIYNAQNHSSSIVKQGDLEAFQWIELHTNLHDVFLNQRDDGAMWLPVFTNRKILVYDSVPYNADALYNARIIQTPTYIYVDKDFNPFDKAQRNEFFVKEQYKNQEAYKLIYSNTSTEIYKIEKNSL